jgi:drug/metabolite transporter (DMT)-like permease
LAELAYPMTAAVVGVAFLGAQLDASQWTGAALVVGAVTALSWHESRAKVPSVQLAPDQLAPDRR